VLGYPGQTCFWYERNYLAKFADLDFSAYTRVNVYVAFGANCLIYPDETYTPRDSTAPADVYACIKRICLRLAAISSKIRVFICPTLNRTYNDSSGVQQANFAGFDARRQQLVRLLLTDLNSFAVGASNIYAQAIGAAGMCFNYPNALVTDGSHLTPEGQHQFGIEDARALARYDNLTLTIGNGTAPVPPAAAAAAPAPPTYSTTSGFVVWEGGDGQALMDGNNPRRFFKISQGSDFGGTGFANTLARAAPDSTVKWQSVIQVKAAAGPTQLVCWTTSANITHYQTALLSLYWDGGNMRIYQGSTQVYELVGGITSDLVVQVVATDKIRFYFANATLPFYESVLAVPTADVYMWAEMGGTPANGKPEIYAQWFPTNPVPRTANSGGSNGGSTAPTGNVVSEIITWGAKQYFAYDTSASTLQANAGGDGFNKYATATRKIAQAYLPGTTLKTIGLVRPASNDQAGRAFGFMTAALPLGLGSFITYTKYLFYWDGTILRLFINGNYLADFNWVADNGELIIEFRTDGIYFYNGTSLIRFISDTLNADLYIFGGAGAEGVTVPKLGVTSAGLLAAA
jgi:hypothetical protein